MEIKFKVHRRWLDREERLVKRIARIVVDTDENVFQKPDGYKWQLNSGNDWWTSGIENGEIKVMFRYGSGGNEPAMLALQTYLEWELGPR